MEAQKVRVIVTVRNHPAPINAYVASEPDESGAYGYLINGSCGEPDKRSAPIVKSKTAFGYEYSCRIV